MNHEAMELDPQDHVEVELVLTHDGKEYKIRRTATSAQQALGDNDVFVSIDGQTAFESDVHQLLPKALKDLFFFPAETFGTAKVLRTQGTSSQSPTLAIDSAIRTLLAGDVYAHAVEDLRAAVGSQALKVAKADTGKALKSASAAYTLADSHYTAAQARRTELPDELVDARAEAAEAQAEASKYDSAKIEEFNEELGKKELAVTAARSGVDAANNLYLRLAWHSHSHFAQKAVRAAITRLDHAEQCGLIPPRIDGEVLQVSLNKDTCLMCGESLTEDGRHRITKLHDGVADSSTALRALEARSNLKMYLTQTGSSLSDLRADVTEFVHQFDNVSSPPEDADVPHLRATISECLALAQRLNTVALNDLDEFKSNAPLQPNADVVSQAVAKALKVRELEREQEQILDKLDGLKTARDSALADLEKKSQGDKESADKVAAIGLIDQATQFFEKASTGLAEFGRKDFERAINTVYSDLVRKPYELRVDEDFRIELFSEGTDRQVAASQAENVLLLIAFLGAIARLAPKYQQIAQERAQFKQVGDVETSASDGFPVVIDAPTSALDEEYERDVVEALPNLLPQIIVPVSGKSVDEWQSISGRVGRAYIMELTSKDQNDRTIRWGGKDHTYSRQDEGVLGRARIVEIK